MTARVLLCDSQPVTRMGLKAMLSACPGIELVGEADTGDKATRATRRLTPDVVLTDVSLPGFDPAEGTRRMLGAAAQGPARSGTRTEHVTPSVILLVSAIDPRAVAALRAGASGVLPKVCEAEELAQAVDAARRGDGFIAPRIVGDVLRLAFDQPVTSEGSQALRALTGRELQVLGLLTQGLSNEEIADQLYIGEPTVKYHVSQILRKLRLRDRLQAVAFAHRHGLADSGHASRVPRLLPAAGPRPPVPAQVSDRRAK